MSLLYKSNSCCLIDHNEYLTKIYENVVISEIEVYSFKLSNQLFCIKNFINVKNNRKRKPDQDVIIVEIFWFYCPLPLIIEIFSVGGNINELIVGKLNSSTTEQPDNNRISHFPGLEELMPITHLCKMFNDITGFLTSEIDYKSMKIKHKYEKFKQEITNLNRKKIQEYDVSDTKDVRELSQKLFEATTFQHIGKNGGNNSGKAIRCNIENNFFLIPPNCSSCVKEQCLKLNSKYDMLIADPPWWNKYIRRLKNANDKLSYSMMYNEDIANIPVKHLLSENCLIAVWCTNAPSCIDAVKKLIFPRWGVEYLTTWYWLKVSIDLEPICTFSSGCCKQPYERLILGKVGHLKDVPEERIIVSVPSALHSHKPPLLDLLAPYVTAENPEVLELFARYLLPNTTSVGYEPLKWQHESLYEMIDNKKDVT